MLTRRRGEAVDVYDKHGNVVVSIHVTEFLPGNVVRLGIAASKEYNILRDNAKRREQGADVPADTAIPNHAGPTVTYRKKREV